MEKSERRNSARLELSDPSLAKLHVTNLSYDMDREAVMRLFEPFGKVYWASFLTKRDPQNIGKFLRKRGEGGGLVRWGCAYGVWSLPDVCHTGRCRLCMPARRGKPRMMYES